MLQKESLEITESLNSVNIGYTIHCLHWFNDICWHLAKYLPISNMKNANVADDDDKEM